MSHANNLAVYTYMRTHIYLPVEVEEGGKNIWYVTHKLFMQLLMQFVRLNFSLITLVLLRT